MIRIHTKDRNVEKAWVLGRLGAEAYEGRELLYICTYALLDSLFEHELICHDGTSRCKDRQFEVSLSHHVLSAIWCKKFDCMLASIILVY